MTVVGQLAWGFVSTSKMVTRITPFFSFLSPINMWDCHFISNISKNICRIAAHFAQGSTTAKIIISTRTFYRRRYSPGIDSSGSSYTSPTGMAISPIPFMEEAEQAAASGQVQPAAATTTARSQANPPARMITLTEHLKGSGPSPRLKRHRSHKDGKTSEPDPKKAVPSNAPLPTSSSVSTAATTFGRLAQDLISDQDVKDWSSSALEANKKALSRAATAVYYRQLSKAREMRALSQTNLKLDSKVKSLQSKVNEHGQAKVNLVNNYNQKMLNLNAARDKALKEQKEAHDLATEAWKKKKDSLEERVLELEGSVSAMNEGHEAALADARNLGARNFMKIFIKKVPDFDWAELWVRAQLGMPRN
ncbi:uncharacterized protein LOC141724922 isoform X2 [Apium graveolens]|uniref:uncharacterized protein LOC141724922 isoform X2 n=1 Tax=Apium graveolens TaxID=4045 RepID=UPI003D79E97D